MSMSITVGDGLDDLREQVYCALMVACDKIMRGVYTAAKARQTPAERRRNKVVSYSVPDEVSAMIDAAKRLHKMSDRAEIEGWIGNLSTPHYLDLQYGKK